MRANLQGLQEAAQRHLEINYLVQPKDYNKTTRNLLLSTESFSPSVSNFLSTCTANEGFIREYDDVAIRAERIESLALASLGKPPLQFRPSQGHIQHAETSPFEQVRSATPTADPEARRIQVNFSIKGMLIGAAIALLAAFSYPYISSSLEGRVSDLFPQN